MKTSFGVLCALAVSISACSTYTPSPVDLQRDTAQWLTISNQLSTQAGSRSLRELQRVGLLLNPELNAQRLTYAKSTSVARFAGLWADPTLGSELGRNLTESLSISSISPSITIPVTGLPSIAKRIAEQYKEGDYWTMRSAERDYMASIEGLYVQLMLNQRRESLINKRLKQLRDETRTIEKLHSLGEISFAEKQIAQQRLSELITEQQNTEDSVLNARLDLVRELGLHPQAQRLRVSDTLPRSTPALLGSPAADSLLLDPTLKAAAAAFNASELELKREIRKQYPELTLSPGFTREGSENETGLGFEFSIPLWNRNREAIASSSGERAIKAQAYTSAWRKLYTKARALASQEQLSRRHCLSEAARLDNLRDASQTQEKLYQLGELDLNELSEMRHEIYLRELSYLEHLSLLLQTQASLKYLHPQRRR